VCERKFYCATKLRSIWRSDCALVNP